MTLVLFLYFIEWRLTQKIVMRHYYYDYSNDIGTRKLIPVFTGIGGSTDIPNLAHGRMIEGMPTRLNPQMEL